jgi:predicted transcriptional regulator
MNAPAPHNPCIVFDYYDSEGEFYFNKNFYQLPEFLQEKIKKTDEYKLLEEKQLITPFEQEEEDGDHLSNLDRASLKAYIANKGYPIKVVKSMDDEEIRNAIRTVEAREEEEEE